MKIISIIVMLLMSSVFAVQLAGAVGHYPVSSPGEYCDRPNPLEAPHNPKYEMWCKRNFKNGEKLYKAYGEIAFNVEYTPEPPYTDEWQTPLETMWARSGDCEDAILLFHHLMPQRDYEGEVIWGMVEDYTRGIRFPHVWLQILDKKGEPYIVEPFSGDWNGIIPMKTLEGKERRRRIVGISFQHVSEIVESPSSHEEIEELIVREAVMFDWRLISQIDDVFAKLTQVAQRFLQQKQH